jgi:hypothetical protein
VHDAAQPAPANPGQQVEALLEGRHLQYGLADYWTASSMTVDSGNKVQIRPVSRGNGRLLVRPWESQASWYDPAQHDASFVVLRTSPATCPVGTRDQWQTTVTRAFGPPAETYQVDGFLILVWNHNLLGQQVVPAPPGRPQGC